MDKYYIMLLTQLKNGYHLEESEIKDLEQYLENQLEQLRRLQNASRN